MATRNGDIVKEVVYETVAQHLDLRREELHAATSIEDPGVFYRIIVDIERKLSLPVMEGNWCFDEGTLGALISYYCNLIENRE